MTAIPARWAMSRTAIGLTRNGWAGTLTLRAIARQLAPGTMRERMSAMRARRDSGVDKAPPSWGSLASASEATVRGERRSRHTQDGPSRGDGPLAEGPSRREHATSASSGVETVIHGRGLLTVVLDSERGAHGAFARRDSQRVLREAGHVSAPRSPQRARLPVAALPSPSHERASCNGRRAGHVESMSTEQSHESSGALTRPHSHGASGEAFTSRGTHSALRQATQKAAIRRCASRRRSSPLGGRSAQPSMRVHGRRRRRVVGGAR
jgi:hypothetical protein